MGNNPKEEDIYEAVYHCDKGEASGFVEHVSYNKTYQESVENFNHASISRMHQPEEDACHKQATPASKEHFKPILQDGSENDLFNKTY